MQHEQEELYEHFRFVVDNGQEPLRLDRYLMNFSRSTTRSKIQDAARAGNVLVNDVKVKPSYRVKPRDTIRVIMAHPPRDGTVVAEDIPIDIEYEDGDVIVVNKEAGMVVHPGYGNYKGTMVNALAYRFKNLPIGSNHLDRPGIVHRIDKNTSGLLVVAKNEFSMAHLAKQFFERTTKRRYLALVWGDVKEHQGIIVGHIGRSLKNRKVMSVFPKGEHGKHAITHYQVVERFRYTTLVECKLETGRTHQIRAHFKHIGHPIFNDETYGGDKILKGTKFSKYKQFVENCFSLMPRHALHAYSLGFEQPHTKQQLYFEVDLPKDMNNVIEKWRNYTVNRD